MTDSRNNSSRPGFGRRPVRETLEVLCCPSLQFMWNNSLLAPREDMQTDIAGEHGRWCARTLIGFRVVRDFGFMKRDQILYRCPFCDTELVQPLGWFLGESWLDLYPTHIGSSVVKLHFPHAQLERWLKETKARNRAGWPPKD